MSGWLDWDDFKMLLVILYVPDLRLGNVSSFFYIRRIHKEIQVDYPQNH